MPCLFADCCRGENGTPTHLPSVFSVLSVVEISPSPRPRSGTPGVRPSSHALGSLGSIGGGGPCPRAAPAEAGLPWADIATSPKPPR